MDDDDTDLAIHWPVRRSGNADSAEEADIGLLKRAESAAAAVLFYPLLIVCVFTVSVNQSTALRSASRRAGLRRGCSNRAATQASSPRLPLSSESARCS